MFKKAMKQAVKEVREELFGEQKAKDLAKPIGGTAEERVFQLEKRFETLCQHLGVHVSKTWKEYEVHQTGGNTLCATSTSSSPAIGGLTKSLR